MASYYNEIDPKMAAWLRELIKQGHIAPGEVDERSIEDVTPDDLRGYTQCHFFAGIGVWSYALRKAGWEDERPVWTGSCPCQPFSTAGKGKGVDDERHLWPAFHWLIKERRPDIVFGEQVAGKSGETWFDLVSDDMEGEGYSCGSSVFPACSVGSPHLRQRRYWVAVSEGERGRTWDKVDIRKTKEFRRSGKEACCFEGMDGFGRDSSLSVGEVLSKIDGSPSLLVQLRGYGNSIVAPQASMFVKSYIETKQTP